MNDVFPVSLFRGSVLLHLVNLTLQSVLNVKHLKKRVKLQNWEETSFCWIVSIDFLSDSNYANYHVTRLIRFINNWLLTIDFVNQTHTNKWLLWTSVANQKHIEWLVVQFTKNDSYEPVLLSESKTYSVASVHCLTSERMTLMKRFFYWIVPTWSQRNNKPQQSNDLINSP